MLIPSNAWDGRFAEASLSRGTNANSQQLRCVSDNTDKSIKRDEC